MRADKCTICVFVMLFFHFSGGNTMKDVAIIGCGIVGAAAAFELSKYDVSTVIIEACNDVAMGTTKANSAILHAGYDPKPGTLMAKLNVRGVKLAKELCKKLDVPYSQCGSLVLAFDDDDVKTVNELYERGNKNGVENMEIWDKEKILEKEPNISKDVICALYAPSAAIVSPWEFALALAETAVKNGAEIRLNSKVTSIDKKDGYFTIHTASGDIDAKYIINAAGVHCEEIHNMVSTPAYKTVANRGEYYLLDKSEGECVKHVVFQCPTKQGKGVLVAPTVHGNLIVGPSADDVADKDDVACTSQGLAKVASLASKSVPNVNLRASIRNFAGNRALTDCDDFIIAQPEDAKGFIDLAGIKSPGLSSAPAIAEMAVDLLRESGLVLKQKDHFVCERHRVKFREMSAEERARIISESPDYGRIICRCETVTLGEILDTLKGPIPPCSVDGVKRRCNAGMGRCQGGFCGPRIVEILSKELGVSPMQITQDQEGSYLLVSQTKGGN